MDIAVAESVLALPMAYNSQVENPSRYQKRQTSYLFPTQSGDLTSNGGAMVYRFLVGSQYFLDTKKSYFSFLAQITTARTGNDELYFTSNSNTWVNRITLTTAQGVLIEEIRDQNVIASMLALEMEPSYAQSVGLESLAMWDYGSSAITSEQKRLLSYQPNRYVLTLDSSGFLNSFNYLPLASLAQGQSNAFQIEIEFAPANQCVINENTSASNPPTFYNYKISNCYFVQSLLQDDVKEQEILNLIKETPFILSFNTHRHFSNLISGANSQHTISISEFQESLQDIKFVFRDNALVSNQLYDSTVFLNPNLKQIQVQIGPTYYPSQPMVVGSSVSTGGNTYSLPIMGEMYNEYTKTCQKIKKYNYGFETALIESLISNAVIIKNKENGQLVVPFDFRIFGDDAVGDPRYNQYFSGINTKASPQPIQFIFTLDNGFRNLITDASITSTSYKVDSFTTYRNNLIIQAGEVYVIS